MSSVYGTLRSGRSHVLPLYLRLPGQPPSNVAVFWLLIPALAFCPCGLAVSATHGQASSLCSARVACLLESSFVYATCQAMAPIQYVPCTKAEVPKAP